MWNVFGFRSSRPQIFPKHVYNRVTLTSSQLVCWGVM